MGIIISIIVYAILAFVVYSMVESGRRLGAFLVNILGLIVWALINNGTSFSVLTFIAAVVDGILFTFVCYFVYNKYQELNKFLGTTVLIEIIVAIIINSIFAAIYSAIYY